MLRRALRAHEQGEFDKAERLYTAVLQSDADNFDALHGLGVINYRRGRSDAALALIQAALKADLDRADGFSSLGLVFHALKHSSARSRATTKACASRRTMPSSTTGAAWRCSSLAGRKRRWMISSACWPPLPIISRRSATAAMR